MKTILPHQGKKVILDDPLYAYAYYADRRVDLLTGKSESSSFQKLINKIEKVNFVPNQQKLVWHFTYELGHCFSDSESVLSPDDLLAIEVEYKTERIEEIPQARTVHIERLGAPAKEHYRKAFELCYKHLQLGDCYQVNLTMPFEFKINLDSESIVNHIFKSSGVSAYAHATLIPELGLDIISQSPECLFQVKYKKSYLKLQTMPIKGSISYIEKKDMFVNTWKMLANSEKDQAELFMITDLMRNDLNRIDGPRAKVLAKRIPLIVPGILHQYSLIECKLSAETNLAQVLKSLHPGGSVTGAPKKRVMQIIEKIENRKRGFYCGSTFIKLRDIQKASINIRTATKLGNKLHYQAGGGITLLSECSSEYSEMELKAKSFENIFIS